MRRKTETLLSIFLFLLSLIILSVNGEYLIGLGSYDMTGPASQVNMMGYGNFDQVTGGIHFRLRARTFIVAESFNGPRLVFVNLDAGMASQLVTIKLLERLKSRYGNIYSEDNVAISGTHTHAGPGGYLQYVTFSVTSLGFVPQSFEAIVTAIELSIVQAHDNLKPGSIFINKGNLENAGINRSPSAYLFNPQEERSKYNTNIDTLMTLLKFVDKDTGKNIGAFSWFATHGTSMSRNNKLISGDNKGAAARFFEDWFTKNSSTKVLGSSINQDLFNKASKIKPTGGQPCTNTTSQGFKVRKNKIMKFVGAFCQSNVGDVSPNVVGAFCIDSGLPCDFNHSSCHGNDQLSLPSLSKYPDEILSTKIIGERQFQKAVDLFTSVQLEDNKVVQTCPAALGSGFAAGTTDGPGVFGFQQCDTEINPFWKKLREPSPYQVSCQKPKTVLLDSGEMFRPYPWAPAILPIQIFRLGSLIILSVPGEFTTMAGRRLREAVKETLIRSGNGEFDDQTHVVIAGLTNAYSQYITTFEEYKQQRYEAASTLYGPHTVSAYIQEFKKLAESMAKGENITTKGPLPPDLLSIQLSLLPNPTGDSPPPGINFGDIKQDIMVPKSGTFTKGDRVIATFWSANPRYDLLTEGTFAVVEMLQHQSWLPEYDDDDFCLFFKWQAENITGIDRADVNSYGYATVEWEVPEDASPGVYRLRHFGSTKETKESSNSYYTGASSAFTLS
uniref:Neutral ceramidase n=1 Tax=Solanum lycopersicum TaxID=4081 RepID=K4BVU6_SOLLC